MRRTVIVLLAALAACDGGGGTLTGPGGGGGTPPPVTSTNCTSLGRTASRVAITVPERGSAAALQGVVFAPAERTARYPVISMLPGGGAPVTSVEWAACALAAEGYVVVVVRPAQGASTASYHTAAVSGIDYLGSAANPFLAASDTTRVGVAGWSLGARSLTRTQGQDTRVDALVAWDNLAVSDAGDAGSPACSNQPGTIYAPRVPAMGQASESCASAAVEAKVTAFRAWRVAGVPSATVVFAGADHFLWSAQGSDAGHALSHYYTAAWFDRWLKNDPAGVTRLISRTLAGREVSAALSNRFLSSVFVDGRDCGDLRTACF